jgi:hypothetical protein
MWRGGGLHRKLTNKLLDILNLSYVLLNVKSHDMSGIEEVGFHICFTQPPITNFQNRDDRISKL